ncbi:MAG: permease-like cell division protein FtsX, partial [Candidatus Liptonbacteria bacterium]
MFTVFSRIINYGLNGFWRNGWPSTATVAMMVLSLIVSMGLLLFNVFTDSAVKSIQNKIDIAVYFKTNAPEDEILRVKQSLESFPEVERVEYISSAQALELFREKHKDDPTIRQAVDELNGNPLQASLNIKARSADQYEKINGYLNNETISGSFAGTTYIKNKGVIDKLITFIDNVNRGGFVLTIMLAFLAGLVVFNTIRLAIYSNRDEIFVMRSVGASNALVRGPYVIEGIISG